MTQQIEMAQIRGITEAIQSLVQVQQAARGTITGLTLSPNASFPTTRLDVAVGRCRSSDDTTDLVLASGITKRLDAGWVAGNGNGGMDTGSRAANTGYHVYLIYKPTAPEAFDVLFSMSATNPTLPNGFTKFRRLGAIMTDGSGNIRNFHQRGDWFFLKQRGTEWANTPNATGGVNVPILRELTVPQGKKMLARIYYQSSGTSNTSAYLSGAMDPDMGTPESFDGTYRWANVRRYTVEIPNGSNGTTTTSYGFAIIDVWTNSNRQIYTMSNDSADVIAGGTLGWMDDRGQFD